MARCGRRTPCANGSPSVASSPPSPSTCPSTEAPGGRPSTFGAANSTIAFPFRARSTAVRASWRLGPRSPANSARTTTATWWTHATRRVSSLGSRHKYGLLAELNEELGRSRTHAESQATATKYEGLLVRSGHRGLSRRCAALRSASLTIEEEERVLEEDPFTGMSELRPRRSQTSASHYASAAMSQTTE